MNPRPPKKGFAEIVISYFIYDGLKCNNNSMKGNKVIFVFVGFKPDTYEKEHCESFLQQFIFSDN